MSRTIQDQDLLLWEVYANSGDFGSPDRATLVFQCLTDPGRRARIKPRNAARSAVEQELTTLADAQLLSLLEAADELK